MRIFQLYFISAETFNSKAVKWNSALCNVKRKYTKQLALNGMNFINNMRSSLRSDIYNTNKTKLRPIRRQICFM